jgi:hypothetical protein
VVGSILKGVHFLFLLYHFFTYLVWRLSWCRLILFLVPYFY